jgi:hypothetical protein
MYIHWRFKKEQSLDATATLSHRTAYRKTLCKCERRDFSGGSLKNVGTVGFSVGTSLFQTAHDLKTKRYNKSVSLFVYKENNSAGVTCTLTLTFLL